MTCLWLSVAVLALSIAPCVVSARSLEDALASTISGQVPNKIRAEVNKLPQVFAAAVGASFPVTSTSGSYVYLFDPASDSFERLTVPLGPIFSERAQTVGPGKLNVGLNYLYTRYDDINGQDLASLVSQDPRSPDHIEICTDAVHHIGCVPTEGRVRLDLEAQIVTLSATYGVTPDLELNVLLPLVRTFLRSSATFIGPDPRAPGKPSCPSCPFTITGQPASEASTGVGDLLLRSKYLMTRNAPMDLAGWLTLSLPTGARADFHGTGDTLLGAALYASRTYAERIEPHVNLSFVLNANKFDRSQVRYSLGADVRLLDWLTLNNDFLGRSDITQPDRIDHPAFVQIERSDVLTFSTGLKVAPLRRSAVFFNALLPLNNDGVRADQAFIGGIEAVF
jgi:hypothetical protein